MTKITALLLTALLLAPLAVLRCTAVEPVIAHPDPRGVQASQDYLVEVDGKQIVVHAAPVLNGGPASFANFDMDKPVKVKVTVTGKIDALKILPTSYGIKSTVVGNTISFTLTKSAYLTIEPGGNGKRPLHLFANPPEANRPDPAGNDVIYFGPGVHEVTTIRPKSGQTIYLADGAILRANIDPQEKPIEEKNWRGNKVYAPLIETSGVKNVKVRGRGIIDMGALPHHARHVMSFRKSEEILVEGITIIDAPVWGVTMFNSKKVVVRYVKQICARLNSDGIDICSSQDVLVEDCFLRNNDDEVCVKTLSPQMESKLIVVRRIVVWNDRARGLGITNETRGDISDVLFQDCDIIHDYSRAPDCSALAVMVSDSGTISDIRFENIRCEDVHRTLVNCFIGKDVWAHDKTRGHIKGVTFKDIQVTGPVFPVSKLTGFDDAHLVEDVTFERLQIQGQPIGDAAAARLQTNSYVRSVRFIPASGRPQSMLKSLENPKGHNND